MFLFSYLGYYRSVLILLLLRERGRERERGGGREGGERGGGEREGGVCSIYSYINVLYIYTCMYNV